MSEVRVRTQACRQAGRQAGIQLANQPTAGSRPDSCRQVTTLLQASKHSNASYQRCGTAWHPASSGLYSRSGLSGAAPAPCTRRLRGKGSGCTGRRPPPAGRCHAGRTKRHRACHLKRTMTQKSTHTVRIRLRHYSEQSRAGQGRRERHGRAGCVAYRCSRGRGGRSRSSTPLTA